jgi:hypothetical protein
MLAQREVLMASAAAATHPEQITSRKFSNMDMAEANNTRLSKGDHYRRRRTLSSNPPLRQIDCDALNSALGEPDAGAGRKNQTLRKMTWQQPTFSAHPPKWEEVLVLG